MKPQRTEAKKTVPLSAFILSTVTSVLVVSTVIISVLTMISRSLEFHKEVKRTRDSYIASETEKLRSRTQTVLNLIRHEQENRDSTLRNLLRQEVNEMYELGKVVDVQFRHLSKDQRLKLIIEIIRTKRFNDLRGYFFMTRYDGLELLFADRHELEGKNLIDLKSRDGKMVIQDMISIARSTAAEGFYSYHWSKPNASGDGHEKIAFVKAFPPYDCFIGTGEYLEDYEEARKAAILTMLTAVNDSSGGYIFAGTWEGVSLIGPAAGKNMWEVEDIDGLKVVQNLVRVAKNGGGTLSYRFPQETGLPPSRKMSYVLAVPEWKWYIGTGVSIDAIETELAQRMKLHILSLIYSLAGNLITMILLIVILRVVLRTFFEKINADMVNLNDFLARSVHGACDSIANNLHFTEFTAIATSADKMILQREAMQNQLNQSQKMEAIGQLAGGVAHDFNNALGGIMGAAELLKSGSVGADEQQEYLDMIITAGERTADLTKKLLTFSRKGAKISSAVDCCKIVIETAELLKHTINKNISITVENRAIQISVIGDDSLLQNAFMNMGINASHAMPNGGELTFTLENLELDAEYCEISPFAIKPGEYLEISIRDTGTGMSPEVQSHIFEPFFTTKEAGKGTGLGMAAVYGTVQEHGGAITVYSEEGTGTVFHIYLPVTMETVKREVSKEPIVVGSGTILVIDDEELVRITSSAMLRSMGYNVVIATNGLEGMDIFREAHHEINLIILDMIMPVMGGRETFPKLREIDPNIPIVIASGFAKEEDMAELKKQGANGFLNKPFRKAELAEMVAANMRIGEHL